jgi:hypothetical protein
MGKRIAPQVQRENNIRLAKTSKIEIISLNYRAITSQSLKLKFGSMKKEYPKTDEK